jgi:hypothetical protein
MTTSSNCFRRKHACRIEKKKNSMTILLHQEVKIILVETAWPCILFQVDNQWSTKITIIQKKNSMIN